MVGDRRAPPIGPEGGSRAESLSSMKIVFDISTPKQARFFEPMIARLRERGCTVSVVTRDYGELNLLMRSLRIPATVLGRYGGSTLFGKLRSSSQRLGLLAGYLNRQRPAALVTLSNPESCRAAFGLKIPIVCFNDVPAPRIISKLTLPLASRVCAPWIIPRRDFVRYGVAPDDLFFYRALDPVIWLKDDRTGNELVQPPMSDARTPVVVCRETEWQSSYVDNDIAGAVAREIRRRHPDWRVITIARYKPHRFYDVPNLLARADLLIGGGGTMCIEAAYFGTPVIATLPVPTRYMEWLFERRLARRCLRVDEAVRWTEKIVANRGSKQATTLRRRARRYFSRMTFPLNQVVDLIQATAGGS